MLDIIPIKSIWSYVLKCVPILARKLYSKDRLQKLIYVDISPRHTSVNINLGPSPSYDIWMQVINLTPFDIEIDRSVFSLSCHDGQKSSYLKRITIKSGEISRFPITGLITTHTAASIAERNKSDDYSCHMSGDMEFNCKIHNFSKQINLDGIYPRITNLSWRQANPAG